MRTAFHQSSRFFATSSLAVLCVLGLGTSGCSPSATTTTEKTESHDHEGHDHEEEGHSHEHRHGANGGEIAVLEPSDFDLEWMHNSEDGTVTMYVNAITEKAAKVDGIRVSVELPGKDAKSYELTKNEDGTYGIKDTELVTAIDASGDDASGIKAQVIVTVDGKENTAVLKNMHHH